MITMGEPSSKRCGVLLIKAISFRKTHFSRPIAALRWIYDLLIIVIVNSKLLKRHSKAKRRAPAYSRALRQIRFFSNSPWEAQVRLPEGERMRQIRGVFQRIVRGKLRSGCQKVRVKPGCAVQFDFSSKQVNNNYIN